jgi:5-formyltetrahydrofolate cyclo-ligase
LDEKQILRVEMRQARRAHVEALPQAMRGLVFNRPPAPVVEMIPEGSTIGFYHPVGAEAPTLGWMRWFHENGREIALPHFATRGAAMEFRHWANPWLDEELEAGPYAALQSSGAPVAVDTVIVPLIAFTEDGHRLGQGGGHYDRWLASHPGVTAIGLAWDMQKVESLPLEPHDQRLAAVVTPTRIYWS